MEEAIPLGRGDVRRVFPDPADAEAVQEALITAASGRPAGGGVAIPIGIE
ncbi:hypothetical protein OG937_21800 [Streptomyces sp. NBC_00510]